MRDPRRPEDAERLLSERERQLSTANGELEQRSRDVETLVRWVGQLERDVETLARRSKQLDALLNSRRWKLGSAISELGRKALLKPSAPAAPDDPNTKEGSRVWLKEFQARREEFRARWEEFLSRRGYLEQAKGRPGTIESTPSAGETPIGPTNGVVPAAPDRWRFEGAEHTLEDLRDLQSVKIVVPIHDAYEDLKGCLESVVRNTATPAELLLIDDASTDPRISSLLAEYETLENVRVLKNDEPLGFARSANQGLAESGDVVLLGSRTEVTPRWLENLILAAHADPRTATVTAVSNGESASSAPSNGKGLGADETGRLGTHRSAQIYPQTLVGSGFCTYIRRAAIDELGPFDAENFPQGYGAVADFCLRARKRGWNHVLDDVTFVFHKGSASQGEEAPETGRGALDRLHPEHAKLARAFASSEDLELALDNARGACRDAKTGRVRARPRILFVLHRAGGGTPYTTRDLMDAIADRYSPYVLVSDALRLRLFRHEPGEGPILVEEWNLKREWRITEFSRPDYRAIVFKLLVKYRFEVIHVRHLFGHTFDLPEVATRLRIPVVLSFHDFYLSCPTTHLIDDREKHCGGICTPGYGQCNLPKALVGEVPDLKHRWLKTWRENVERMFEYVDAFVTTSFVTRDIYLRSLPSLHGREFEVIEHGRDLEQERLATAPGEGPIRVLIPGNIIGIHKGAGFLRELKRADARERLELHFLGSVADNLRDLGVVHGPYERHEFNERVREIAPSFVGIFSIWPETYCHTLTEAWAAGVPVLVSDIGTLRERVEAHGGGWTLDHENPERAYKRIVEIAGDHEAYARELKRANLHGIRPVREMSDDYDALYGSVARRRRPFERAG